MAVTGVQRLVYGVDELDRSVAFHQDFGLDLAARGDDGATFVLPETSSIVLRRADDPSLPPAFLDRAGPREVIWGVDSEDALRALAAELSEDREVVEDSDGVIHTFDDSGINIGFGVWSPAPLAGSDAPPENTLSSIQRWNQHRRWYPHAKPKMINHVVFGVPDVDRAVAFYLDRLGFKLTDIMRGVGMFMRCDGRNEHHNLFFRRRRTVRFEHISYAVENIDELMVGASLMQQRGWSSQAGLGRHRMGSLLFYYIESPAGGQAEYTADCDYVTDDWKPRLWDVEFGHYYWVSTPQEGERISLEGDIDDVGGAVPNLSETVRQAAE